MQYSVKNPAAAAATATATGAGTPNINIQITLPPQTVLFGHAIAVSLVVFLMTAIGGRISGGQFNPVVSIAALVAQVGDPIQNGVNIACQLIASFIGAAILKWLTPDGTDAGGLGYPRKNAEFDDVPALILELWAGLLIGGIYVYGRMAKKCWTTIAIHMGVATMAIICSISVFTGAAMNTARCLGPSILSSGDGHGFTFEGWWALYLGPILGACGGAALVKYWLYAHLCK